MRTKLSLLFILLFLLIPFASLSAQTETPTPGLEVICGTAAPTWTPVPTSTPQPTYSDNVLSLSPIAYWKLDDTSGTVATDYSGNGYDGSYSGATLAGDTFDGAAAATFDGINDFVNVYSAGLASAFNASSGTAFVWARVPDWSTVTARRILFLGAGGSSNAVFIQTNNPSDHLSSRYWAGGVSNTRLTNAAITGSPSGFFHTAITWDTAADEVRVYFAGIQVGATLNGLGTWSGALHSSFSTLGASSTSATNPFLGSIAHVAVFDYALSPAQIMTTATIPGAPPPTPTPFPTPTAYPECVTLSEDYFWTVVPPAGTPGVGQAVRYSYLMSVGDVGVSLMLGAVLITLWVSFLLYRRRPKNQSQRPNS